MLMNLYTYVHSYKEKWYKEGLPERDTMQLCSLFIISYHPALC